MIQSLTVVGGNFSPPGALVGLVSAPSTGITSALNTSLQTLLTSISGAASMGSVNFDNLNVAGESGNVSATVGTFATGLLAISNTSPNGATVAGSANVSLTVPNGYNVLFVEAPGTETIAGNGASNFLAVFGDNSSVNFNSEGGSGTVAASSSGDFVVVGGTSWSVIGSNRGNDTINSNADSATIDVYGTGNALNNAIGASTVPSNVVGLAGATATVNSYGTNDLVETYSGKDIVSINSSANVLVNGGYDTVYAGSSSTAVKAFFNLFGGNLDFINNSSVAATVSGNVPNGSGGSATTFGGTGGGVYIGGTAGSNSLIGGTGSVTLTSAGTGNILSVNGSYSGFGAQNVLNAGSGSDTLGASATTDYNAFYATVGGSAVISTKGSGQQTFVLGNAGSQTLTGSTVSGSENLYIFQQVSSGGSQDIITNFRVGKDHIDINAFGGSGVSVYSYDSLGGKTAGTVIYLSNNTQIDLYGVSTSQLSPSIVGGTFV